MYTYMYTYLYSPHPQRLPVLFPQEAGGDSGIGDSKVQSQAVYHMQCKAIDKQNTSGKQRGSVDFSKKLLGRGPPSPGGERREVGLGTGTQSFLMHKRTD